MPGQSFFIGSLVGVGCWVPFVEDEHTVFLKTIIPSRKPRSNTSVRSQTIMKIDADEKKLLESVERGEWKSSGGGKRERTRYAPLPLAMTR